MQYLFTTVLWYMQALHNWLLDDYYMYVLRLQQEIMIYL